MKTLKFSTSLFLGSALALGLSAAACSSSDSNGGPTSDAGTGGATGTGGKSGTGGAKSAGGSTSTGGKSGTGGAKSTGGSTSTGGGTSTGGAKSTGGTTGTGGAVTDAGPDAERGDGCVADYHLDPTGVPAAIALEKNTTLVHQFHAIGTQNYQCTDAGAGSYAWVATPEAKLYDHCGVEVGSHYAGPRWKFTADNSVVKGTKIANSPLTGTIDRLLLSAVVEATGEFNRVTFVQRLHTIGGVAPAAGDCTVAHIGDAPTKVPYTADYYFYTGSNDGGI